MEALTTTNFYQNKYDININRLEDSPDNLIQKMFQPFITRLASHHIFHQTVINHDNFDGNTIEYIYLNIIPDLFIQNDIKYNGNYFGRRFDLLDPSDYETGVGLTFIGELFLNYGYLSIFFLPLIVFFYYFFSFNKGLQNTRGLFFYVIISFISIHSFEGFLYSFFQKFVISIIIMSMILEFVKKDNLIDKILNDLN